MPRWVQITLPCLITLMALNAHAQQPTAEGAARTASTMSAIVQFCGVHYIIDGPKAVKFSAASRELALKWAPPGRGKAMVDREFKRRFQEVQITGPSHWCQNQREIQKGLGTGMFLN